MQDISISCDDGYRLSASVYRPLNPAIAGILIGPATGIRRRFYHHFANYLCEQGFAVLTYDNRGIGDSLSGHISNSDANLVKWGQLDMPAALRTLQHHAIDVPLYLVGHSAGGQLFGLMDNAHRLSGVFNVASSSGQLRNMPWSYRFKAHFFMNMFIPASNALFGHTRSQWFGMGEPLPAGVAQQWRKWCNGQGYVKTEFGDSVHTHYYNEFSAPSKWVFVEDDNIAVLENVHDMLSVLPNLPADIELVRPRDYDLPAIGHMGFFSRQCQALWPKTVAFFAPLMAESR